mmetsp:Transcript_18196/g.42987  ORF Transcript_18196/g.42987 Transcript_18196/m.42987 type:complete len:453 (+) Transcript_18196:324-1682(+)
MATCDPLLVLNFNYVPPALLAPTNEAFDKLSTEQVDYLVNNVPELSKILTYHVIGGETFADDIPFDGVTVPTLLGVDATVDLQRLRYWSWHHFRWLTTVAINHGEAFVVSADLDASNGVIHAIDNVLIPPDFEFPKNLVDLAASVDDLFTLSLAIKVAGLDDTLADTTSTFTVFGPTNKAFREVLEEYQAGLLAFLLRSPDALKTVLLHHVLEGAVLSTDIEAAGTTLSPTTLQGETIDVVFQPGTGVIVNNGSSIDESLVIDADNIASNGVVHIVDTVLLPDEIADTLPISNIVEAAADNTSDPSLQTLAAAVTAAKLADTLSGPGLFTVFAPKDEAFAALGSTLDDLLLDPTGELKDILLYHVTLGYLTEDDLIEHAPTDIHTLNGAKLVARVSGNRGMVLDDESGALATIEESIPVINGIIHIVDKVLIPPEDECPYSRFWCWVLGWFD